MNSVQSRSNQCTERFSVRCMHEVARDRIYSLLATRLQLNCGSNQDYENYKKKFQMVEKRYIFDLRDVAELVYASTHSTLGSLEKHKQFDRLKGMLSARDNSRVKENIFATRENNECSESYYRNFQINDLPVHQEFLAQKEWERSEQANREGKMRSALQAAFSAYLHSEDYKDKMLATAKLYYPQNSSTFDSLPNETWVQIFSSVSYKDLLSLQQVSKRFKALSKEMVQKKHFEESQYAHLFKKKEIATFSFRARGVQCLSRVGRKYDGWVVLNDHFFVYSGRAEIEEDDVKVLGKITHFNLKTKEKAVIETPLDQYKSLYFYRISGDKFVVMTNAKPNSFLLGTITEEGKVNLESFEISEANRIEYYEGEPFKLFGFEGILTVHEFDLKDKTIKKHKYRENNYKINLEENEVRYHINSSYYLAQYSDQNMLCLFSREKKEEILLPETLNEEELFTNMTEKALYSVTEEGLCRFDLATQDIYIFDTVNGDAHEIFVHEWENKIILVHSSKTSNGDFTYEISLFNLISKEKKWSKLFYPTEFIPPEEATFTLTDNFIIMQGAAGNEVLKGVHFLDWNTGEILALYEGSLHFRDGHIIDITSFPLTHDETDPSKNSEGHLQIKIKRF